MNMRAVLVLTGLLVSAVAVFVAAFVLMDPFRNEFTDRTMVPVTPTARTTPPPGATATTTSRFRLEDGQVVYRAPSPMRVNEVQRVTVRVAGPGAPLELTSDLPGTGAITVDPAKVGSDLAADLSGPEFQITRVGGGDAGKRELQEGGFAEWAWDVRPSKSGHLKLDFVLYVAKDGGAPVYYRTYTHEVDVEVSFSYSFGKFVKDYGALTRSQRAHGRGCGMVVLLVAAQEAQEAGTRTGAEVRAGARRGEVRSAVAGCSAGRRPARCTGCRSRASVRTAGSRP